MRKTFKKKKYFSINKFIIIILSILILILMKTYIFQFKGLKSNVNFIKNILSNIDNQQLNRVIDLVDKNIFNNPTNILEKYLKYESNSNKLVFSYVEKEKPLVYIYNSHQGEEYSIKYLEEYNITPNVLMAANMLSEKLNKLGINNIVEENNIIEYMNKNNLNHAGSYIASRNFLEKILNKYNSSIRLYIDLHRDSISHDLSYIKINNNDCAKVLFVIGLENPNYEKNLKVTEKINNIINAKYPNLSRGILKKQGYGVNGVYNQDLNENIILLELGGHENNIDEINNTLELVSIAIKEYLNEEK